MTRDADRTHTSETALSRESQQGLSPQFRAVGVVGVVCFLSVLYLLFIVHYWANVPDIDDWNSVWLVSQAIAGHLTWSDLWIQHNENRMIVPNLILVVIGVTSHESVQVVMIVDAVICIGTFLLVLVLFRSYLGRPLTAVSVLAIGVVWFSVADWQTALWAFQLALSLILLLFVVMLYLLLLAPPRRITFAVAILTAVAASFSSIQGLLLWPVGLLCILWISPSIRSARASIIVWITGAVVVSAGYFWGYQSVPAIPGNLVPRQVKGVVYTNTSPTFAIHHPGAAIRFLFVEVGNVVPVGGNNLWIREIVGAALCAATAFVVVQCVRKRLAGDSGGCLPVAIVAFSLLFDGVSLVGRGQLGIQSALASRYTMSNLLLLVAILIYGFRYFSYDVGAIVKRSIVALAALIFLIVQVISSTNYGMSQGAVLKRELTVEARLAATTSEVPANERLCYEVTGLFDYGLPILRESLVAQLKRQHLSIFAPGPYRAYRADGPPVLTQCQKD